MLAEKQSVNAIAKILARNFILSVLRKKIYGTSLRSDCPATSCKHTSRAQQSASEAISTKASMQTSDVQMHSAHENSVVANASAATPYNDAAPRLLQLEKN